MKRYAFRRIESKPATPAAAENLSYLYIGNGFRKIQENNEGFAFSFFVHSFEEALKLMKRLENAKRLPSVLVFDGSLEIGQVRSFLGKIQEQEAYAAIPVFAEVSDAENHHLNSLVKQAGITDLVRLENNNTLLRKVTFYKSLETNQDLLKTNLQEGFNWKLTLKNAPVRAFDILVSSVCMVLLSPLYLTLALLVKYNVNGSVLEFHTERGLGYRNFNYYRFRTDCSYSTKAVTELGELREFNLNPEHSVFQGKGTTNKIGQFLQRTNLDELPALFNILKGDISFLKSR
ncbi:MAG: sugar transferase [Flavitalea sp.]